LLAGDHPIASGVEDRLGRRPFAEIVATEVIAAPRTGGFVTAVTGPWGSGKTSVINMAVAELEAREAATVLVFNPWLFSGTEQLVEHFFRELGAQLGETGEGPLARIGWQLGVYGQLAGPVVRAVPGVGGNLELTSTVADTGAAEMQGAGTSLRSYRARLGAELARLRKPLAVVVDDIDRLDPDEVRDVFRLVRLVGDFPNVVYLLGFDRPRVERTLGGGAGEQEIAEGRAYLEKIVQISQEVPPPEAERLTELAEEALSRAIGDVSALTLDPEAFLEAFAAGIRPMIATLRDVRRYANHLASRVRLLGAEVELTDILALEAIRVFAPESHKLIAWSRDALTMPAPIDVGIKERGGRERAQLEALLDAAGDRRDAVEELIRRTFPAAVRHLSGGSRFGPGWLSTWLRTRRVAHPEILDVYLTRTIPAGVVSAQEIDAVFANLEDGDELEQRLARLDESQLGVALERLEHYEADFPSERPEVPIVVLFGQLEQLREGRGTYDGAPESRVPRVVLRLLRRLDSARVEEVVRAALPQLGTLSARMELIDLVGHREGAGQRLIDENAAIQLEAEHVLQILSADVDALARERKLTPLIARACEWDLAVGRRLVAQLVQDDRRLLALLRGATGESGGDYLERVTHQLDWELLAALFGEDALVARIEALPRGIEARVDARGRAAVTQARLHAKVLQGPEAGSRRRAGEA